LLAKAVIKIYDFYYLLKYFLLIKFNVIEFYLLFKQACSK